MDIGSNVRKVQARLLEMAVKIAGILERNDVPYQIAFGTLLGAVRHGGFIPWDDDFDLTLFDDTYDRAIEILRSELPQDMFVEDEKSEPRYFHGWAHVKDLNSAAHCDLFPQDNLYSHHGLSVDLYRWKRMHSSRLLDYRLQELARYLGRKREKGVIGKMEHDRTLSELRAKIEQEEIRNPVAEGIVYGMAMQERFVREQDIFPLVKYKFENLEFYGPNNYDGILRHFYGDYMQLPEEGHRFSHYSEVNFYE